MVATQMGAVSFRQAWRVNATLDQSGRQGSVVGYWDLPETAQENAKGSGWYGSDGAVTEVTTVTIEGRTYELAVPTPIEVRRKERVMVKQVTMYQASDGTLHPNAFEAEKADTIRELERALDAALSNRATFDVRDVVAVLITDPHTYAELLQKIVITP